MIATGQTYLLVMQNKCQPIINESTVYISNYKKLWS